VSLRWAYFNGLEGCAHYRIKKNFSDLLLSCRFVSFRVAVFGYFRRYLVEFFADVKRIATTLFACVCVFVLGTWTI